VGKKKGAKKKQKNPVGFVQTTVQGPLVERLHNNLASKRYTLSKLADLSIGEKEDGATKGL